jgi:hypothetical protein
MNKFLIASFAALSMVGSLAAAHASTLNAATVMSSGTIIQHNADNGLAYQVASLRDKVQLLNNQVLALQMGNGDQRQQELAQIENLPLGG